MSSTATTSGDVPSLRVQSASNKDQQETPTENINGTIEKTSRPSSASQKTAADTSSASVIVTMGAGISTGTSSERPPSANQQSINDISTELRPGSALKNASQDTTNRPPSAALGDLTLNSTTTGPITSRPPSANQKPDELGSHGYSIVPTNSRPSSASQKAEESTITIGSRPPSAKPKTDESVANDTTTKTPTNSRPPSASQKANELTTDNSLTAPVSSRPPSASQKANESITNNSPTAPVSSRPPSANQNSNESNKNDSNIAPVGSRSSTASHTTDVTNVSELNNNTAPTNSRPSSANQKTDLTTPRIGSRPPSASHQQSGIITGDYTTEQQTSSGLFNSNDPNITQPIIGRPSSSAKKPATDESNIVASPDTLTENVPTENTSATPRIGSASKNLPESTTTEKNS